MTVYATIDTIDAYTIAKGAAIHAFETREAAEAFLRDAYDDVVRDAAEADEPVTLIVETGQWSDCWFRAHSEPQAHWDIAPFTAGDLQVQRPGSHPGGNEFWITPKADVLVAVIRPAD